MNKKRGFTLIELIVTIAIVSILIAALVPIFPMVTRIGETSNDMTQAQNLAKLQIQCIENELRYAKEVNIETSLPASLTQGYRYIFLNSGLINKQIYGYSAENIITGLAFDGYTYNISFAPVNSKVLEINVSVIKDAEQIYNISSKLHLNNIINTSITGAAQSSCVSYKITDIPVTIITVNSSGSSIETAGLTMQMSAGIYPYNATNKGVAWSVDDAGYASISQTGLLTPLKNGMVTVKATALDGSAVYGTKQISISNQNVTITALTLTTSTGNESLHANSYSMTIIPNITPSDATNKIITWSVDNVSLATIDNNGVLTSKNIKSKSVFVTATTNDGSGIKATIEIKLIG